MKKRAFAVFFILLVFHVGLIIPKTKFECFCSLLSPESFSPCCNCPSCVSQRGGFLSACGCDGNTGSTSENLPSIKRVICFCGSSGADFDLSGLKYPVLLIKYLFPPPTLEIHHFFSIPSALFSQVYLTPPDHPS
jgi:hypothetical protein